MDENSPLRDELRRLLAAQPTKRMPRLTDEDVDAVVSRVRAAHHAGRWLPTNLVREAERECAARWGVTLGDAE
jgi:hypothetical protein